MTRFIPQNRMTARLDSSVTVRAPKEMKQNENTGQGNQDITQLKTRDKAIRTSLNSPVEYVGPQMQHVVNIPIQTVRCKNYALDKHTLNIMSAVKRNVSHITYTITLPLLYNRRRTTMGDKKFNMAPTFTADRQPTDFIINNDDVEKLAKYRYRKILFGFLVCVHIYTYMQTRLFQASRRHGSCVAYNSW